MLQGYMQLKKDKIKKRRETKKLLFALLGFARNVLRREYVEIPCPKGDLSELENVHAFTAFAWCSRVKEIQEGNFLS